MCSEAWSQGIPAQVKGGSKGKRQKEGHSLQQRVSIKENPVSVKENPVSVIGMDLFRMCQRKAQEDPVLKK